MSLARGPLQNRVALVTGASSGIGEAIAHSLGECGVGLALVGRRVDALEVVTKAIGNASPRVRTYGIDLSSDQAAKSLTAMLLKDFDGVDILVHSAGIFAQETLDATSEAGFDLQYHVNLRAPHSLTRELAASLRDRQGQIVFINSSVARNSRAGLSQYAATKVALKAVADAFREEFNPHGVRVLSVFVGRTATPMQKAIFEREGRSYKPEQLLQPDDIASAVINCLSLPPTAEVTELDIRPMMKS